ncbi:methyltransferase [Marinobacterium arenosum]|uniref:methyltransferase n=1 Tax=Marinobacterium arenosum TaxID=2862496 RepID=UPI001C95C2B4|nr:methyltransferase [Marinobacterium arenosum]MBY4678506.1 methyltransferase [Marinobacterium arenosum]
MSHDSLLRKAMLLLNQGKTGPARAICRKLLAQNPDDFNTLHLYGVLLLKDADYPAAQQALHQALELKAPQRMRAQALSNLALACQYAGQLDDALQAINQALRLLPGDPACLANRANLHELRRDWPAMRSDLQQLLENDANAIEAHIGLALAERKQGTPSQALARLNALPEPLQNFDWLQEWTLNMLLCGRQAELEAFLEPLGLDVDDLRALADYCAEQQAVDCALPLYRRCLALDPQDSSARHMLDAAEGTQSERAPASYVSALYDQHAGQFEQRLVGSLGYDAPQRIARLLSERLAAQLPAVLDLGCGTGLLGAVLKKQFQIDRLSGVDLSEAMLAQARTKDVYDQLIKADLLDHIATGTTERWPLVCAADVLIYLGELAPLFERLPELLTDNGLFAATIELAPDEESFSLLPSGRYRHSARYLQQLADHYSLQLVHHEQFPLRKEGDQLLPGLLFLLAKSPAG